MFVAVLMSSPGHSHLDRVLVESMRNAWGGGDAVWLDPGVAAEFALEGLPANRWDVWADLQNMGVDLCIVPAAGRRKRVLLADMDSTMIQQECIDELGDVAGVGAEIAAITVEAMNGRLDFDAALRSRVALMKGLDVAVIDRVLAERITLMPGGDTLVATMRAAGAYCALVSGGFTAFTQPIARRLGFHENRANGLLSRDGLLTGEVQLPILGRQAKVDALEDILLSHGLTDQDAMAVGDGANDLGMLTRAGMGVALHAKAAVQQACSLRINHGDLTALLYLQGYSKAEFKTAPPSFESD